MSIVVGTFTGPETEYETSEIRFTSVQEAWLNMPKSLIDAFAEYREHCVFFFDYEMYVFSWAFMCNPPILYIVHGMPQEELLACG